MEAPSGSSYLKPFMLPLRSRSVRPGPAPRAQLSSTFCRESPPRGLPAAPQDTPSFPPQDLRSRCPLAWSLPILQVSALSPLPSRGDSSHTLIGALLQPPAHLPALCHCSTWFSLLFLADAFMELSPGESGWPICLRVCQVSSQPCSNPPRPSSGNRQV